MNKFFKSLSFVLLFLICFSSTVISQEKEAPKYQLLLVHEDIVKPSMLMKYEANVKKMFDLMKKHNLDIPMVRTSSTQDFHYYYVSALENYGSIDKQNKAWDELIEKAGEKAWKEIEEGFEGCYSSHKSFTIKLRNDLSYIDEDNPADMNEMKYFKWAFYSFEPGSDATVDKLAKQYRANALSKGVKDPYYMYTSDIGMDMSVYVVLEMNKDATQHALDEKKNREVIGDINKELNMKMLKFLKDFEVKEGKPRPDLTYVRK